MTCLYPLFQQWSSVSGITFIRVRTIPNVDIKILFGTLSHFGCPFIFDGPYARGGSVLGHAYYPQRGGDLHLDDDETWTVNSTSGAYRTYTNKQTCK